MIVIVAGKTVKGPVTVTIEKDDVSSGPAAASVGASP